MDYLKKTVILKGDAEGTFTMQRSVGTKYSLTWHSAPKNGDILVFDENSFYRLSSLSGVLPCDISSICAVAVGNDLSVRGQLKPFNWFKARSTLASASRKAHKQTIIKPVSPSNDAVLSNPPSSQDIPPQQAVNDEEPNLSSYSDEKDSPPVLQKYFPNENSGCPVCETAEIKNPFPKQYPHAKWTLHEYPSAKGRWHYLTGELYTSEGKPSATALALPGSSGSKPAGSGFNNYCLSTDGRGYWIRTTRI